VALNTLLQPLPPLGGREAEAGRESDWVEPLGGRLDVPPLGGREAVSLQLVGRGTATPQGPMRPALTTGPL